MTRTRTFGVLLIAGLIVAAGVAGAAGLSGAEAAKARKDSMKGLGAAMKATVEQVKTGAPDMAVIKLTAAKLDAGAKALPTWFPAGSGAEVDPKTETLPVIWTDKAGFAAKAKAFADAAANLNAVAQKGDSAAVLPAFKAVGAACKGCHETYKAKDKA